MKRIINRKLYDTETSELVFHNQEKRTGYRQLDSKLYRTKNGNWFLTGEDSAIYEVLDIRGIETLADDEALIHLEKYSSSDDVRKAIIKHFKIEDA